MTAWCSGAPGTALALARRNAIASDPVIERYLDAALATTLASVAADRAGSGEESFCLCHGVAGNAEILALVGELNPRPGIREAVWAAAEEGLRRHHPAGTWPCGIRDGGESPGLLTGLAGIGYFYLRLHDPSIPSPLLI
jgi:lantibiotic biosynthesis protein